LRAKKWKERGRERLEKTAESRVIGREKEKRASEPNPPKWILLLKALKTSTSLTAALP